MTYLQGALICLLLSYICYQLTDRKMNEWDKPVTAEPKTGHWINKDFRKEEYVLTGKCSVCGQVRVIDKFCPNCGCRMVEPQETQESEVSNAGSN